MVSRFREELKKGRSVGNAVEIAVATSGKAVTFSGLAVAIGLGGLLVFNAPALRSFGIGGMLTSSRPVLRDDVPAGAAGHPRPADQRAVRRAACSIAFDGSSACSRARRPPRPGVPLGLDREHGHGPPRRGDHPDARPAAARRPAVPAARAGHPDADTLPAGLESREAASRSRGSEAGEPTPIIFLADVAGDPASERNVRALAAYGERSPRSRAWSASRARSPDPNPADRPAADHRRAGRPLRGTARALAAAARRRPVGDALHARVDGPVRRHQPAQALVPRRHRGHRASARSTRATASRAVGGQAAPATTSSSRRPSASRTPSASR